MKIAGLICLAVLATIGLASQASGMSEHEYALQARRMRAVLVSTANEIRMARAKNPAVAVQLRGSISGIIGSPQGLVLMIRLSDGESVEVGATAIGTDIQTGTRVKCLARGSNSIGTEALKMTAIAIDGGSPLPMSPPARQRKRVRSLASGSSTKLMPLPSRGSDNQLLTCKRAISYFNPKLPASEVERIANSIVGYSTSLGVDPYFVVAVVAAESRFNPNARSYKGAMGLGQLMPGTAAGMGVSDPYDPADNLAGAIRLLRGHLEKYKGQPYQAALALAAYNAGSGAVRKHGGVPPYRETHNYIWKIYEYYCWMHGVTPEPRPNSGR